MFFYVSDNAHYNLRFMRLGCSDQCEHVTLCLLSVTCITLRAEFSLQVKQPNRKLYCLWN